MISYVTLGTNDPARAKRFYDAVLGVFGHTANYSDAEWTSYGHSADGPTIWLATPFDGRPATVGNGSMVGLQAASREQVAAAHAAALAQGGRCEGPPGPRPQYGPDFYAAYVRDPDGNKLSFVFRGA